MKAIEEIPLVDTHEHLQSEEDRIKGPCDPIALFLSHYLSTDFLVAGMEPEDLEKLRNPRVSLEEKWDAFARFWDLCKNTGYGRVLKIALRDLYGESEITLESIKRIASKMKELHKPGFYRHVIKERANIEVCIVDVGRLDVDRELFAPVIRFDDYINLRSIDDLRRIEERSRMSIHSLEDLVKALKASFERAKNLIVGIKTGLAYRRPLFYEKTSFNEAEKAFNRIRGGQGGVLAFDEVKPLQDFLMHKLLSLAESYGLPVQIHTGLQEGTWNKLTNSDPSLLINLFQEYRGVCFDVFHAGYPYSRELGALAKQFPNVYVDLCWMHAISPEAAKRILSEWLDLLPSNKILAFGGDYIFVEGTYGHSRIARENVTMVLSEKVDSGALDIEEAVSIAHRILKENAENLFLKKRPCTSPTLYA